MSQQTLESPRWTFLTNHGHVLLCLAVSPELRLRDVAARVGVTERAVQRIVSDLEEGGYLTRRRSGRQNEYDINPDGAMRHPLESHRTVQWLIALVDKSTSGRKPRTATAGTTRGVRRGSGTAGAR